MGNSKIKEISGITQIENFSMTFTPVLVNKLREKCGFDEATHNRIEGKITKDHIRVKIEHHSNGLIRRKIWYSLSDGKNRYNYNNYIEEDDTKVAEKIIYGLNLVDFYSKKSKPRYGEYLKCSFGGPTNADREVKVYLTGGNFGMHELPDGTDMPEVGNVIFKLNIKDVNGLEKYHKSNFELYNDSLSDWYYAPSDNHREYTNLDLYDGDGNGIIWELELFDFTGEFLPKLSP